MKATSIRCSSYLECCDMANHKKTSGDFWAMVDKFSANGCWNWTGGLWATGYGRITFEGKSWKAHRLSVLFSVGELDDTACVLHRCDNRKCVNPEHLFLGTRADNNRDKVAKNRQPKGSDFLRSRLTEQDILNIRSAADGLRTLSEKYGVSWSHINNIKKLRKWKHVA
jgi:hypothetical protein